MALHHPAGDHHRIDVPRVHPSHHRGRRVVERGHVHPVRAEHDEVCLLARRQ